MKLSIFVLGLFFAFQGFGGDDAGNGGHGVVCRDGAGNITSIELLDFYEARVLMHGLTPDLGNSSLSVDQKIDHALERISKLDPYRAFVWRLRAHDFLKYTLMVKEKLPLVNDFGKLTLPPECSVEQIALQKKAEFPESKVFKVNARLWSLLDRDEQAGLILHEVIYEEAIRLSHKDSVHARYFNENLTANGKLENLTGPEYIEFLRRAGFRPWVNGVYLDRDQGLSYFPSGNVRSGRVYGKQKARVNGNPLTLWDGWEILFYESGAIHRVHLLDSTSFLNGNFQFRSFGDTWFYENGMVCSAFTDLHVVKLQESARYFRDSQEGCLTSFHPTGHFHSGQLQRATTFNTKTGQLYFPGDRELVVFDENELASWDDRPCNEPPDLCLE